MLTQIDFNTLYSKLGPGGKFGFSSSLTLGQIVAAFIPYLFVAAGILLLLYLIYGGFSLMLARGEPKVVGEASARITNALIGFFVVFLAYLIVQAIGTILKIPDFQIFGSKGPFG